MVRLEALALLPDEWTASDPPQPGVGGELRVRAQIPEPQTA